VINILKLFIRAALWLFCAEINTKNKYLLNTKGPLLIIANHPNSFLDAFIIGGVAEVKVARDIVKLEGNTLTLNNNIKEVKEPILLNRTRLSIIPFDNKYFIKVPLFKSRDTHKDYPIPMRSLRYFKHGTLRCKDINTGEDIDFDLNGFSIQITPEPNLGYVKVVITQNKANIKIIKSERL
jgi:hypothetical protein